MTTSFRARGGARRRVVGSLVLLAMVGLLVYVVIWFVRKRVHGEWADDRVTAVAERTTPETILETSRWRVVRPLLIATVAVVVGLGGLLSLKLVGEWRNSSVHLVPRSVPALGFAVAIPSGWTGRTTAVGGARGVLFSNEHRHDAALPDGFSVLLEGPSIQGSLNAVVAEMRRPAAGKDPIALDDGLQVSGHRAFRYSFNERDIYVQQWWVERSTGTFLVEFKVPVADEHEAALLAERIVGTFTVK